MKQFASTTVNDAVSLVISYSNKRSTKNSHTRGRCHKLGSNLYSTNEENFAKSFAVVQQMQGVVTQSEKKICSQPKNRKNLSRSPYKIIKKNIK